MASMPSLLQIKDIHEWRALQGSPSFGVDTSWKENRTTLGLVISKDAYLTLSVTYEGLAHPFVDGNLRGTTVALNAGLVTLGLDIVAFKDLARHDELLGIAFVGRNDPYRPLAEHIAELLGDTRCA